MRVNRITLWSVDLTSHETYYMAEGKTCATVKSHVLCLETDNGLKGWGEVCPIPHYLPAFADGVPSAVAEMAAQILGISPLGVDAPMRKLDGFLRANRLGLPEYLHLHTPAVDWLLGIAGPGAPRVSEETGCCRRPSYRWRTALSMSKC